MNDKEFESKKPLKLKYRRGDQIVKTFCKIGSPQIRPPIFNMYKFENFDRSTPESCEIHTNLINDKEFGSKKLLKLKYSRGDQIIQKIPKIGSSQKLGPPSLI